MTAPVRGRGGREPAEGAPADEAAGGVPAGEAPADEAAADGMPAGGVPAGREVVVQAAGSARAGRLAEAADQLDALLAADPAAVDALDLRARVHAQRGELAAADACWVRVQQLVPADPDAAAGRRAVADIREGRLGARPVLRPSRVAILTAGVLVVAGVGTAALVAGEASGPPPPDPLAARLAAAADRGDDLQARLDAVAAGSAAAGAARTAALDRVVAVLATDGVAADEVIVERRAADVRVVFVRGLFSAEDRLTRSGAAVLRGIGAKLAAADVTTTVVGHVVTVPGGRSAGGSTVALDRALRAARELAATGPPLTSYELVSADQADVPFADDARNRTVTLLLTPRT